MGKINSQESMVACRGLWRGTTPTVLRLGMGAGLHFCFLDSIKAALERRQPDGKLTSMDAFVAGGLSRAGAAIISCPVTVVKTRMEYGGPGGTHYKVIDVAQRAAHACAYIGNLVTMNHVQSYILANG